MTNERGRGRVLNRGRRKLNPWSYTPPKKNLCSETRESRRLRKRVKKKRGKIIIEDRDRAAKSWRGEERGNNRERVLQESE